MKQQLRKPWLVIALTFLLVSGVIIRIAEYQLPTAAHRLYAEVENRYDSLAKQHPVPDTENALPVYEEAVQLMLQTQQKYPEREGYFCEWKIESDPASYHLWDYKAYVLPLPSQPFPEELKAKIQRCVEIYRPVLDKLHYAATLKVPDVFWNITETRAPRDMVKPLFMEALLCILNNDEAGVMKALGSYRALTDALANSGYGYGMRYRGSPSDTFWDIYHYGMERNVFTPASLATLQEMFVPEQAISDEDILRDCYIRQKSIGCYINKYGARKNLLKETFQNQRHARIVSVLASSLRWYETRLHVHGATATLPGMQALQRYMFGDASDELSQLIKHRANSWAPWYLNLEDPFGRYGYLNFDHINSYAPYKIDDRYKSDYPSLSRTIIALGRYYREKGAFPENIEGLAGYVPEKDLNIFHDFKYKYGRTDTGWIIYKTISQMRNYYEPKFGYPLGTVKKGGGS